MPSRYDTIGVTKLDTIGSRYYQTNMYPTVEPTNSDYYVITTIGDRLDLIAYDFYKDSSLWWVIASANALPGDSIYPPIGMQLRIPVDLTRILTDYKLANT